ncbi:helix-turn-helix domain-containing protein [Sphingobacterium sp. SG20118]|uniref:AraC family transcriptional regulator n=1 Tax=Sphingobacterium TaxID=28453 RepID=UPI002468F2FF|nr:helix-turn-helix domain-containing protein [Sphingobacterium faecium]MDH5826157.1 helix-turn-helix domain-containing protein [Sphingobacterium faecium]
MLNQDIQILTLNKLNTHISLRSELGILTMDNFLEKVNKNGNFKNKFYAVFLFTDCKGSLKIDNQCYDLIPHQFFFLNYNQVFSFQDTESCKGYVLLFTKSFYNYIYTGNKMINSDTALVEMSPYIILKNESRKDQWQSFEELKKEYQSEKILFKEVICLLLKVFVLKYIRYSHKTSHLNTQSDRKKTLVDHFNNLVNINFKELKTTSSYAKKLNITPNYLNAIIKESLDIPAGKIIKNRVILEAERLLLHTTLSVTEISYELGFSDKSHFGKYFKAEKEYSPNQYRKANTG